MNLDTLQEAVEQKLKEQAYQRTFSLIHEGEKIWVKLPDIGEANIWHTLLSFAAKLLNNNFFRPTVVRDAAASLAYEGSKLETLYQNGISVPRVLIHHHNYLVLEDAGHILSNILNAANVSSDEKKKIIIALSSSLASMHNKGFYHSRPALRDIGYKEGKIYFLDFEENLEATLSTDEAIIRDGFIYVHSLYRKLKDPELIQQGISTYAHELEPARWQRLKNEAKRYAWIRFLLKPLYSILGKDGIAVYKTLDYLIEA